MCTVDAVTASAHLRRVGQSIATDGPLARPLSPPPPPLRPPLRPRRCGRRQPQCHASRAALTAEVTIATSTLILATAAIAALAGPSLIGH